jgi:hypothetical protein
MNKKRKNNTRGNNYRDKYNDNDQDSSNNNNSYFSRERRKRNQQMKIIIPSIITVIILAIALTFLVPGNRVSAKYGNIGSAHEHAVLWIDLNGTKVNFTQPKYMARSNYIHLESYNGTLDGTTIHRHATNVPMGEFIKSVGMDISNGCFITDNGTKFCNNKNHKLKFFVNGNETKDIMNYVLKNNDRILIIYGNQSINKIQNEIQDLYRIPIHNNNMLK